MGWIQCDPWQAYDGGDHILHLGQVRQFDTRPSDPLLFAGGNIRCLGLSPYDLPRVVQLDGRPIPPWILAAHRVHELSERGHDL